MGQLPRYLGLGKLFRKQIANEYNFMDLELTKSALIVTVH